MEKKQVQSIKEETLLEEQSNSQNDSSSLNPTKPLCIPKNINIQDIRKKLNMSRKAFSDRYGFNLFTLRNWENNHRHPDQAVLAYLYAISKNPLLIEEILRS